MFSVFNLHTSSRSCNKYSGILRLNHSIQKYWIRPCFSIIIAVFHIEPCRRQCFKYRIRIHDIHWNIFICLICHKHSGTIRRIKSGRFLFHSLQYIVFQNFKIAVQRVFGCLICCIIVDYPVFPNCVIVIFFSRFLQFQIFFPLNFFIATSCNCLRRTISGRHCI